METSNSQIDLLKSMTQKLNSRDKSLVLYKRFMDILPIGIYIINAECKAFYINEKATEILGQDFLQPSSIYKLGTDELYPIEQNPLLVALKTGEDVTIEDMEVQKCDCKLRIHVKSIPIKNAKEEVEYALAAFYVIKD